MGIYIKGMEMPKRCGECPLSLYPHSPCWKNGGALDWENRPNWCPLIELPPHGDLIDRDKYEVFSYTGTEGRPDTFDDGIMFMLDRLGDAPVIVEAEEVE